MMLFKEQTIDEIPSDDSDMEIFISQLQMDVDIRKDVDGDVKLNLKAFKKLVAWICALMGFDEKYIALQIVWIIQRRFEMVPEMHAAVSCISKWKDASVEFKRNQLDILLHSNGLLNRTKQLGLNWGNFHQQFDKFLLQKLDLLKERQSQKNQNKVEDQRETFANCKR